MTHVLAAAVLVAAAATAAPQGTPIDVAASNWAFTPAKITLHAGVPTQLRFTSKEGVHGVASSELGIPKTTLVPGKTVTLTVTPAKTGEYKVPCAVVCGAGHATMILTVDVVQ
jgi:cytochrome c oxidase subunit 2